MSVGQTFLSVGRAKRAGRRYTMSAAARAQRRRAGLRGGRARLGWRKPNPVLRNAVLVEEYAARKAYAAALKRLHAGRRPSRALAEVGRFNPRKETYVSWWIRFQEAQRPTALLVSDPREANP